MKQRAYSRGHIHRGNDNGGSSRSDFVQAVDIEQAAHGVNRINRRTSLEKYETNRSMREQLERARITLSPTLDEWLKK